MISDVSERQKDFTRQALEALDSLSSRSHR